VKTVTTNSRPSPTPPYPHPNIHALAAHPGRALSHTSTNSELRSTVRTTDYGPVFLFNHRLPPIQRRQQLLRIIIIIINKNLQYNIILFTYCWLSLRIFLDIHNRFVWTTHRAIDGKNMYVQPPPAIKNNYNNVIVDSGRSCRPSSVFIRNRIILMLFINVIQSNFKTR